MEPMAMKKEKSDTKKRIGGLFAAVFFDPKLNKGNGESGVELLWHNNRDFCKFSQHHKDEIFAWNYTAGVMKQKESYLSNLYKSNKTNHYKCSHIRRSTIGKGNMTNKRYKPVVGSAVKADLINIKKGKKKFILTFQ